MTPALIWFLIGYFPTVNSRVWAKQLHFRCNSGLIPKMNYRIQWSGWSSDFPAAWASRSLFDPDRACSAIGGAISVVDARQCAPMPACCAGLPFFKRLSASSSPTQRDPVLRKQRALLMWSVLVSEPMTGRVENIAVITLANRRPFRSV